MNYEPFKINFDFPDFRAQREKDLKLNSASDYVGFLKELREQLAEQITDNQDVIAVSPLSNGTELIIAHITAKNPDFIIAEGYINKNRSFILSSIHQFQICYSIVPQSNDNYKIGFNTGS
jgi:hypothetical protein